MAFWQAFAPFLTSKLTFEKSSDYPFVFIETITSMMKFIMVIFPLCFRWHSFQLYFQQIIQIKVTNDSRVRFLFHFLWNVFMENSFHTSLSLTVFYCKQIPEASKGKNSAIKLSRECINHNKRFHEQKFSKYYFFKNFFKYCNFFWKKRGERRLLFWRKMVWATFTRAKVSHRSVTLI